MYNRERNEITFPHLVPGTKLGEKEHNFNNINGGMHSIGQFGLITSDFYGGRCTELGLIKEYGFYACKDRFAMQIIGFYVDDPYMVTDLGKSMLRQRFPAYKVVFMKTSERPTDPIDFARLEQLRAEALVTGYSPEIVNHSNAEELVSLIKVHEAKDKLPAITKPIAIQSPVLPSAGQQEEVIITKLPSRGRVKA